MRDLAAIEISSIVGGLKERLESARFKNFYDLGNDSFIFALTKEGKEIDIYIRLNKAIGETSFKEQNTEPSQFALTVRKLFDNRRLVSVEQHRLDRIVLLKFDDIWLLIEMFAKGNLLAVNKDHITLAAYKTQSYKERELRRNMVYSFPKSEALGPEEMTEDKIRNVIKEAQGSDDKLISALARRINVGPLYLEDTILKAGLAPAGKAKGQDLEKSRLAMGFVDLFEKSRHPDPRVYYKGDAPADFAIMPIVKYEKDADIKTVEFKTLDEMLDQLYIKERSTGIDVAKAREIEELRSSVEKLRVQIVEMDRKSKEYAEDANMIFLHMNEINSLAEEVRRRKPKSLEDVAGLSERIKIKTLDLKNKTIKIEVPD